eukprot:TRINITY_DN107_c0_g1_i3.p1 TRINITY_DN107_c0_g1~~TRINITY_DN107_c0_g1_i3.p1  ORF type:complete len:871 (-),score=224.55 TRINITY_DN107_c0_g1_i3:176-2737(-)
MSKPSVIRIKPFHYIHVLDNNTNVTRLEIGPATFTRQDHEIVLAEPTQMVAIPPRHYAIIANPLVRTSSGQPERDRHGQFVLRHGDSEVRFEQDPFPLYPGEKLVDAVKMLEVIPPDTALRLKVLRDFDEESGDRRRAGDEYLFEGPGTYIPRVDVKVLETIRAQTIGPNQALKLRARKACTDKSGAKRTAGEEWLVRSEGSYLLGVDEELVETVDAFILTEKSAIHLRANKTFRDVFGNERKAGAEWLVTVAEAESHIPDVYEQVVGEVRVTTLNSRQYCVVVDPVDPRTGKIQLGQRQVRTGELSFFLCPGERLEKGIQDVYVLGEDEALLLRATTLFTENGTEHAAGDRWMIYGPADYVPPVEVEVLERRRAIPLDDNEGIYVRDIKTGKVRSVCGQAYMLKPNEELWEKELPKAVEELLQVDALADRMRHTGGGEAAIPKRDATRVVTYRVPHNAAVQIYDYKNKRARVVFGPDQVMLGPDEHFTVLNLSGGKPKKPNTIKSLALLLGPDFMTDIVKVETSDHARLQLQLSYNWEFKVDKASEADAARLFQVPDFVGDACQLIASRVRGVVASTAFDEFHKGSARIIRQSIFGVDEHGKVGGSFPFEGNGLVITNIDIQSVEPVDQRTRDSLQKSVQLAIEITTKSQEANARHEAERVEQEARGKLERQKILDEAEAERAREALLRLQAESVGVESAGRATAEAKARAAARNIEGQAAVELAKLKAQATKIESQADLSQTRARQEAEVAHARAMVDLEIQKAQDAAKIEAKKFGEIVKAIGPDTIRSIAQAGPELQAKLLKGLGLKGFMITNGQNPINLFGAAQGLIGGGGVGPASHGGAHDGASVLSD